MNEKPPIVETGTILQIKNFITTTDEHDEEFVKQLFKTIDWDNQEHLEMEQEKKLRKENVERETERL